MSTRTRSPRPRKCKITNTAQPKPKTPTRLACDVGEIELTWPSVRDALFPGPRRRGKKAEQ